MKALLLSSLLLVCTWIAQAQNNYLDNYVGATITLTTIGTSANQISQPRDLDFKPNSNELWLVNYGTSGGGSNVIFHDAGLPNQTSEYREDTHTGHFMMYPTALAFSDEFNWASVQEVQNTSSQTSSTFMGPTLWSGDLNIFAEVFQNNWLTDYPLGSHLDMLHQSPYAMGIASDSAKVFWVLDGHNGNICKYDYVEDHGPGYDDHSAGKIWRYTDVSFTRVNNIPSHAILDKASGWLYFIDGGPKQIKRLNTNSGTITGNLTVPSTGAESLSGYYEVEFATVEILATLSTQPCGIDFYNGRLIVSDNTTGDIYLYSTDGTFTLLETITTGHPGMMGVKVGPDGHIWCVNRTESKVYRLDVAVPILDAAILEINAPSVESYLNSFYSTAFNVCDGNITPSISIANTGNTTITSMELRYMIDEGPHVIQNWAGSLAPGSSVNISLPSSAVTTGSHRFDAMIMMTNGIEDDVDLNNIKTGAFRAIAPAVTLPFNEGFTLTTFPPDGWNYVHFNPNNLMSRVTAGGFGSSTGSMKMNNYTGPMEIVGQEDYLMSPLVDFSTATATVQLKFSVAYARYNSGSNDRLQAMVSTDCGETWVTIYNKAGSTLASTTSFVTNAFTPNATQWRTDSVNLSSYAGQPEVMLMFTTISDFGNNVYVDDIEVGNLPVGINGLNAQSSINLFPNPASGMVYLSFTDPSGAGYCDLVVRDMSGRTIAFFPQVSQSFSIDVHDWIPGAYLLHITDQEKQTVRKFIVD